MKTITTVWMYRTPDGKLFPTPQEAVDHFENTAERVIVHVMQDFLKKYDLGIRAQVDMVSTMLEARGLLVAALDYDTEVPRDDE